MKKWTGYGRELILLDWKKINRFIGLVSWICLVTVSLVFEVSQDVDVWWHLKTGKLIWEQGRIFTTDIFSYTGFGNEWINHEWLFEVIYHLFYRTWGLHGLILARCLIGVLTFGSIYLISFWMSQQRLLSLLGASVAFRIIALRYFDRPSMLTTLFIVWILLLVTGVRMGNLPKKLYGLFLILFPFWANIHGGIILGLAILGILWSSDVFRRWKGGLTHEGAWWYREEVLFFLVVLSSFFNPFGFRILAFPFENMGLTVAIEHTLEWYGISNPYMIMLPEGRWIPFLFLLLGFSFFLSRGFLDLSYYLVLALTALMTVKAVRFLSEFACVAVPLSVFSLSGLTKRWRYSPAIFLILNLVFFGYYLRFAFLRGGLEKQEARMALMTTNCHPSDLVDFLEEHHISGRVFNDLNLGAYLIFRRSPEEKVFFDSRHNIYGNTFYTNYLQAAGDRFAFEKISQEAGPFDYIVLNAWGRRFGGLHTYLWGRPEWHLVYASVLGLVYVRDVDRFRSVIEQFDIKDPPDILLRDMPFLKSRIL